MEKKNFKPQTRKEYFAKNKEPKTQYSSMVPSFYMSTILINVQIVRFKNFNDIFNNNAINNILFKLLLIQ